MLRVLGVCVGLSLVAGCATGNSVAIDLSSGPDAVSSKPLPGESPDEQQQQVTYEKTVYSSGPSRPITQLLEPGDLLAARDSGYRLVHRTEEGKLAPVTGGGAWKAEGIRVRLPRPGELTPGTEVFYCTAPHGDFQAAREAVWHAGKVDRVDPVFQQVEVAGQRVDPTTAVLVRGP